MAKRSIALILSLAMVLFLTLSAYGGASDLDHAELKWYIIGDGQPLDMGVVMDELNVTLKERINVTLDLQVLDWGSFVDRIQIMSSSSEPFDLCFSSGWTMFYAQAAQGYYADLTDLLPAYAPKTMEMAGDLLETFKVKGQYLAVPNLQGMAYKDYVLFNADIAEKYNIPDKVDGLPGLNEYFAAIKEGEPQLKYVFYLAGLADTSMGSFTFGNPDPYKRPYNVAQTGVYKVLQPDGSLKIEWDPTTLPGSMENARWKYMAYNNGWTPADVLTMQFSRDEFINGNVAAIYIGLNPDDSKTRQNWGDNFKKVDISAPLILFGDMISGAATSVSYHSQNKERAVMLMELVNTEPEIFNTLVLGVEGKHWVRDSDGFWTDGPDRAGYPMAGYGWSIGNDFIKFPEKGTDPNTPALVQAFDQSAEVEPAAGFVPDLESLSIQLANISALNEILPFTFGLVDPEVAGPELRDKLIVAGIQDIADEIQRQLDAFLAGN